MSVNNSKSIELANRLWSIANDLRGNMDSIKFKNYILGIIFYRYLSERTENYICDLLKNDSGMNYKEGWNNTTIAPLLQSWSIEHLGYIISPENLFSSLVDSINNNTFSISHFEKAIRDIIESTIGQESEFAFDKLFDDMNLRDKDLGKEISERTRLISSIILRIADIPLSVDDLQFDILGEAYMILISKFASDAGKKGGEFFTPTSLSRLMAKIVTTGLSSVRSVYDCTAGSGSLMLEIKNAVSDNSDVLFYGQEKLTSTFNLLRMNLLMHGIPYHNFTVYNDDTLIHDCFANMKFHIQVANPPYSQMHSLSDSYLSDPRFSCCGVLAPKKYSDLAFVEHMVYHMADDGRIAVLLPHGVLSRGRSEKKIREYLLKNLNCIDAIIGLPEKMFHIVKIPVICMILQKTREYNNICFIDASKCDGPELSEADINKIVNTYVDRKNIEHYCHIVDTNEVIQKNDCNLSITRYVSSFAEETVLSYDDIYEKILSARNSKNSSLSRLNGFLSELELKEISYDVQSDNQKQ